MRRLILLTNTLQYNYKLGLVQKLADIIKTIAILNGARHE